MYCRTEISSVPTAYGLLILLSFLACFGGSSCASSSEERIHQIPCPEGTVMRSDASLDGVKYWCVPSDKTK